jgi:hypothetical protein
MEVAEYFQKSLILVYIDPIKSLIDIKFKSSIYAFPQEVCTDTSLRYISYNIIV